MGRFSQEEYVSIVCDQLEIIPSISSSTASRAMQYVALILGPYVEPQINGKFSMLLKQKCVVVAASKVKQRAEIRMLRP